LVADEEARRLVVVRKRSDSRQGLRNNFETEERWRRVRKRLENPLWVRRLDATAGGRARNEVG
jgi:hypothetical protein